MDGSLDDHSSLHLIVPRSRSSSESRNSSPVTIRGSEYPPQSPSSSDTDKLRRPASEDIFLTPRAQSPFWPTTLASLPGQYPPVSSSSPQSDQQQQQRTQQDLFTPQRHPVESIESSDVEAVSAYNNSSSGSVPTAHTIVPLLGTPSPSRGTAKQCSAKKLSGSRRSSSRIYSDALEEVSSSKVSTSPPIPVRQASSSLLQADDGSGLVASPPILEPALWADQLRNSLIAEGLPETAKAAEQDLRQELRRLVVPVRSSSTVDDNVLDHQLVAVADAGAIVASPPLPAVAAGQAATAIDMPGWSASHPSDISRTPSTSTAGSSGSMAKSQTSTETAPSSVLTEDEVDSAELSADMTAGSASNSSGGKDTLAPPIAPDGKSVQTKLRRYHALVELVETERSYANDLAILVHIYLEALPMQPFFEDHPARIDTVVRNAPELLAIHSDIASVLEGVLEREGIAVMDPGSDTDKALSKGVDNAVVAIGNLFANVDRQLQPYRDFCARHAEASSVIRDAERKHNGEDFAQFEKMCSSITRTSRPGSLSSKNSSTTELHRLSRAPSFSTSATAVPVLRGQSSLSTITPITPITPVTPAPADNTSTSSLPVTPGSGEGSTMRQGGRLNFQDLLIKPVQRLCLYPLVLHTLLKHTGPDDAGKEELEAALATVKRVADEVDEAGRRREHFLLAELVASRVEPKAQITRSLLSSYGRVYLSGTLDVLYHHSTIAPLVGSLRFRFLGLFVYHGWLLIIKVSKSGSYEPRFWFPLYNSQLSSTEEQEGHLPHAFRLTFAEEHHFELAASSSRERALWVEALTAAIATAPLVPEVSVHSTSPLSFPSGFPSNLLGAGLGLDVPGSPASGRLVEVATRPQATGSGTSNADPLSSFLQRQAAGPGSSDVIVRLTPLAQRSTVDKGMVFSDTILSARAITHKDGSFQPGGSLVRTGPSMAQTSDQTTPPVLASWQAATSAPQGPITAAVGVAMGLARSAKRSSSKSSTNVFEAAAQQYLAAEESRLADEVKTSGRESSRMSGGEEGTSAELSAFAKPGYHRRMRSSFGGRGSLRPMSTILPDFENAVQSSPTTLGSPVRPSAGQVLGSPISSSVSPNEDTASQSASLITSSGGTNSSKKRAGSLYGSSFRDAFSRRPRSHSVDLDSNVTEAQGNTLPDSPQSSDFVNGGPFLQVSHPSSPTASDSPGGGQMSRGSSIRRAFGSTTPSTSSSQREKSLSRGVDPSQSQPSLRSPGTSLDVAALTALTPPRRRTSSAFGVNLGLMAPPFGNIRRSLTSGFKGGIASGSRSADSSRRSSVADAYSDVSGSSVSSSSGRPSVANAIEQTTSPAQTTARHSKSGPPSSSSGNNKSERTSLCRSATDTSLLAQQHETSCASAGGLPRPFPLPRNKSSPLYKASSLNNLSKRSIAGDQSTTAATTTTTALAPFQASGKVFSSASTESAAAPMSSASAPLSSGSSLARSLSKRLFIGGSSKRTGSYSMSVGASPSPSMGSGKSPAVGRGADTPATSGLPFSLAEEVEIGSATDLPRETQSSAHVPWSFGSTSAVSENPAAMNNTSTSEFDQDVSPNTTPLGNDE